MGAGLRHSAHLVPANILEHFLPAQLAQQTLTLALEKFTEAHRDSPFLVVHLPDANGSLAAGLHSTAGDSRTALQPALQPLSFNTSLFEFDGLRSEARAASQSKTEELLLRRFRRALQFVVPLRKRSTVKSAFQTRISVGRAANQDIVLRDASVSKSHAWFQVDEAGTFHVADSGSTNGTQVNARALEPRATFAVEPGDVILFGSIETVLVDAESLWKVVASARIDSPPTR